MSYHGTNWVDERPSRRPLTTSDIPAVLEATGRRMNAFCEELEPEQIDHLTDADCQHLAELWQSDIVREVKLERRGR